MKIEEVMTKTAKRALEILEEKFHYRVSPEQKAEVAIQIRQESGVLVRDDRKGTRDESSSSR